MIYIYIYTCIHTFKTGRVSFIFRDYNLGVWPLPSMPVANKGLVRDSLLKMVNHPGGHWNPGKGIYPNYTPPKFNIAPEQWWLQDYFPFEMVYFQGRTVKLQVGNPYFQPRKKLDPFSSLKVIRQKVSQLLELALRRGDAVVNLGSRQPFWGCRRLVGFPNKSHGVFLLKNDHLGVWNGGSNILRKRPDMVGWMWVKLWKAVSSGCVRRC